MDRLAEDNLLYPVEDGKIALLIPVPLAGRVYIDIMSGDVARKLAPTIGLNVQEAILDTMVKKDVLDFWEIRILKLKDCKNWIDEQLGTVVPGTQLPLDVMNFLAGKGG